MFLPWKRKEKKVIHVCSMEKKRKLYTFVPRKRKGSDTRLFHGKEKKVIHISSMEKKRKLYMFALWKRKESYTCLFYGKEKKVKHVYSMEKKRRLRKTVVTSAHLNNSYILRTPTNAERTGNFMLHQEPFTECFRIFCFWTLSQQKTCLAVPSTNAGS